MAVSAIKSNTTLKEALRGSADEESRKSEKKGLLLSCKRWERVYRVYVMIAVRGMRI